MGRSKLPNKKEFDRIVEEAFSSDERHSFSEQYKQKKDNIQRGIIMKKINNKPERIFVGAVAAAVMAVVAIPTGVVIKNKLNPDDIVPGTDENAVIVEATENPDPMAGIEDVTEIPEIAEEPKTIEFGWLPEDMPYNEDGQYAGKIHRESDDAGITPRLFKNMGDRDLLTMSIYSFPTKDEYDLDGRHVTIYYSYDFREVKPNAFGRNVWIRFEGSQYAVFLYVTDNLEDDVLAEIIENISLVPSEEDNASDYEKEYNEIISSRENSGDPDNSGIAENPADFGEPITRDELNLISIGEKANKTFDHWEDHTTVMDITVTDAYITDSFDGLTTDGIGWDTDFSEYTDENGKVIDSYTEWYEDVKQPDGLYRKELIDSETVGSKILIVNMTLTNNSDAQDEFGLTPWLMTIHDGKAYALDDFDRLKGCNYLCNMEALACERNLHFSLSVDGTKGSKNSVLLEPGESTNIRLAYLIHENEIGNLYLNATYYSYGASRDDLAKETLVDLCGIEER